MGSKWTVTPESVRIELRDGDGEEFWIEVKKQLNMGEKSGLRTSGFRSFSRVAGASADDVEVNIDWRMLNFVKMRTWLVDWSLKDEDGRKLPRDLDGLQALRDDIGKLIEDAIDKHAETMKDLEKKVPN